jgi:hypothetical protein
MAWYAYLAYFFAGGFLANAVLRHATANLEPPGRPALVAVRHGELDG